MNKDIRVNSSPSAEAVTGSELRGGKKICVYNILENRTSSVSVEVTRRLKTRIKREVDRNRGPGIQLQELKLDRRID